MNYAPVAIFCYNRPGHLTNLLQSLLSCPELSGSPVYFFRDGPRSNLSSELESIAKVDKIIEDFHGGLEKTFKKSPVNKGLADSIRGGVDEIMRKYEKIIVLEDDLVVSPGFLTFMNNALNLYSTNDRVMHISGYMFPIALKEDTVFFNYTSCWGWATWKDAWNKLIWEPLKLKKELLKANKWDHFTLGRRNTNASQLEQNISGQKKTWAVRWNASVEINDGFCLHPGKSLVNNTGFDGSGENCTSDNTSYNHPELASKIEVKKIELKESQEAIELMKTFYQSRLRVGNLADSLRKSRVVNRILDVSPRKVIHRVRNVKDNNLERIKKLPRYREFEISIQGLDLKGIDSASFLAMWRDIFEKEVYRFQAKNDNPIIIDGGANIGLASLYLSKLYPHSKIFAYEADPSIFPVLLENLEKNECLNVEAKNMAIWHQNTTLSFESEGADAGKINNQGVKDVQVEAVSLLTELERIEKRIDLLKLDIEGSEYDVIKEQPAILDYVDFLFIEYHSFEGLPQKLGDLLEILADHGMRYKIYNEYDIMPDRPFTTNRKYGAMDLQVNIFAEKVE